MGIPALKGLESSLSPASRDPRPVLLLGSGALRACHEFLGQILVSGEKAVVADGANCFDVYRISSLGHSAMVSPRDVLSRARVSRAASAGQLLALLEGRVAGEASRFGARWVFALGPLDLLADHDVKEPDARRSASRIVSVLSGFSGSGFRVVVAQEERRLARAKREFLLEPVKSACNAVAVSTLLTRGGSVPLPIPLLPSREKRMGKKNGKSGGEEGLSLFTLSRPGRGQGEGV